MHTGISLEPDYFYNRQWHVSQAVDEVPVFTGTTEFEHDYVHNRQWYVSQPVAEPPAFAGASIVGDPRGIGDNRMCGRY